MDNAEFDRPCSPADVPDLTLVEFYLARLAEVERAARETQRSGTPWRALSVPGWPSVFVYDRDNSDPLVAETSAPAVAEHIARHGPAWVLRDVAAKRRIVEYVKRELDDRGGDNPWWYADRLLPTLRLLAEVYDDHPDYRAEWRG